MFTKNWVTQNGGHETHGKGKSEQMQPENSQLTLPRRHNTGPTSLHIMVSTYHKFYIHIETEAVGTRNTKSQLSAVIPVYRPPTSGLNTVIVSSPKAG